MNITELNSYNLADAVKFHNRLNPRLWDKSEHLLPEVRDKLLEIAADFQEFLGVADLDVVDITISGSNAAYSYTPHSDIDLHLVVKQPEGADDVYQELFNAKKYQYNDMHDIRIRGADVELYVQPADESPVSLGEYSIRDNKWLQVPRRKRAKIDQSVVKHKYEDLKARIESALKDNDSDRIYALISKIKVMRQAGLDSHGEFGPENLAFKMLRSQGYIGQLYKAHSAAKDRELSLKEKAQPTSKRGEWWKLGETVDDGAQSTWDGVSPDTDEFLSEDEVNQSIIRDFIRDTAKSLGIKKIPKIYIHNDSEWSERERSFGRYVPDTNELHINLWNRHLMDALRTTAHELVHCRQQEISPIPADAGETGSKWENQANATAGVIMRRWAEKHPDLFEASGYIPTAAQANDPRFKMALTVDVQPGQTGREANKMMLKTDAQGKPALLMKTVNLREGRMPQPSQGPGQYKDLNKPLGPETPPTMPKGTVRVDVSDVYDWYKLGQHISNLKGLGKHDFGMGPPGAIISFGDEDTEHKYIKDLEKTGLTTTDIDPGKPERLPGIKPQKVDPTYNVAENEIISSLRQELNLLEDEFLGEIKMTSSSLRQLASKIDARVGMEFEMIVPGVAVDDDDDYEADYSMDQRTRSFSDIEDFFLENGMNSRREVRDTIASLQTEFQDWVDNQIDKEWQQEGFDRLKEYIESYDYFDRDEAVDTATEEIKNAYPDLDPESDKFQQLVGRRIDELEYEFVENEYESRGRIYDEAFSEFQEEKLNDTNEREFLDDNYPYMSDVESAFALSWPYYNSGGGSEGSVEEIANEFSKMIGKPVNASTSYHGARREPGKYVVEPDGSLEGNDDDDGGLEFVSPPLTIDEMITDLNKVREWAGMRGIYTNDSTGLHINISVPGYSQDKLDYVKLALLMGDEYVLEEFGREANHYAKAAMGKIRDRLKANPDIAPAVMDKMREHMEGFAAKSIHSGSTDKYTSINTKDGYIEFRSPGGDWLDEHFDKIESTLLRFTVALDAAIDPTKYRQEYFKKLYKLLDSTSQGGNADAVKLFSKFSSGNLDKSELIKQVRSAQLSRKAERGQLEGEYWWEVSRPGQSARIELVARTADEAKAKAVEPRNYPEWRDRRDLIARPLRPYQAAADTDKANWGIYRISDSVRMKAGGQFVQFNNMTQAEAEKAAAEMISRTTLPLSDFEVRKLEADTAEPTQNANQLIPTGPGPWEIYDIDNGQSVRRLDHTNRSSAGQEARTWIDLNNRTGSNYGVRTQQPAPATPAPVRTSGNFTGHWLVTNDAGEVLHRFGGIGNSQSDANRVALAWLQRNPSVASGSVNVSPEMQQPAAQQPAAQQPNYRIWRAGDSANTIASFYAPNHEEARRKFFAYLEQNDLTVGEYNYSFAG